MNLDAIRRVLLEATKKDCDVILTTRERGVEGGVRGGVVRVTGTHVVVSWGTGESCIHLQAIERAELAPPAAT